MFDGVLTSEAGLPPVPLQRPSMSALAYVLRHPQTWPPGFKWDFSNCHTCAMGLCYRLWHERGPATAAWFGGVAELLGIPPRDAFALFVSPCLRPFRRADPAAPSVAPSIAPSITPDMIADEIDHYLARPGH